MSKRIEKIRVANDACVNVSMIHFAYLPCAYDIHTTENALIVPEQNERQLASDRNCGPQLKAASVPIKLRRLNHPAPTASRVLILPPQ